MIGISPSSLVPLSFVHGVSDDSVPNKSERFKAVAKDWIEERYEAAYFRWEKHWHYAPYELLSQAFTREELICLWHSCIFSSELDEYMEKHEPVVWKVRHSLWRYGCSQDYNRFAACYNGLSRLVADLPDFDIRLTYTRSINTAAWAEHGRENPIYLDASFGALLYYKGNHVMTIGFACSEYGILVAQVQLRQKRGNRFLYKLPEPYMDFALALVKRAFPDDDLYLVTGASTVKGIRAAYGKNSDKLAVVTEDRIEQFYNQPLREYDRTDKTVNCCSDDGRVFVQLVSKRHQPNLGNFWKRVVNATRDRRKSAVL